MGKEIQELSDCYDAYSEINELKKFLLVGAKKTHAGTNIELISHTEDTIDINLEDKLRFTLNSKGINATEIRTRKVTRSEYVKRALELSDALKRDIDCSIGDASKPKEYVNGLLQLGEDMRSSDVYVCPDTSNHEEQGIVQLRVDGRLRVIDKISLEDLSKLSTEFKNRTDEKPEVKNKSHALEATFYNEENPDTQYRLSIMQTNSCSTAKANAKRLDSIVVRILKTRDIDFNLEELGFFEEDVDRIRSLIREKSGVILVTGETCQGKSTTIGSMLTEIYKRTKGEEKIITFEDPPEYKIKGALQFQVVARSEADEDKSDKMSYYTALKNCLRQAPDVIMIGEVRDSNTAKSLFDTAETGHLLISTMHAENARGATTRLASLGIEGSTMNNSLLGICSQILIRKNCPDCIQTRPMNEEEMEYFFKPKKGNDPEYDTFRSNGLIPLIAESKGNKQGNICPKCEGTSFFGRAPLVEIYMHHKYDEKHAKIIADICHNDPLAPIRMNELFKEGIHEPFALNALKHMLYHTTSPKEIMQHLPPSMFSEYRSLLIKKTNEIIDFEKNK